MGGPTGGGPGGAGGPGGGTAAQGAPGGMSGQGPAAGQAAPSTGGTGTGTSGSGTSGASGLGTPGAIGGGDGTSSGTATTLAWLESHRQEGTTYLVATFGAQAAARLIVASDGESVLPIGGFNGADPVPTLAQFQTLVSHGALRYVLVSGEAGGAGSTRGGGFGATGTGSTGTGSTGTGASGTGSASTAESSTTSAQIRTWVLANCTAVSDSTVTGLYECGS